MGGSVVARKDDTSIVPNLPPDGKLRVLRACRSARRSMRRRRGTLRCAMSQGFPSMERYLARLPHGLDSYPHLTAKAAIFRQIIAESPDPLDAVAGLPPALEERVRNPPAATDWVREVEFWALLLCVYDRSFADAGGMAAYGTWTYGRNRALLSGPLYRMLFALLSPERLLLGATQRYAAFHRGTVMSQLRSAGKRASFRLTTPAHVLPEIAQVGLAAGFRAALDLSGASAVDVTGRADSPDVVEFLATWR